jgi:ribonuclease P/MRP protein subunit RPP25
MDRYVKVDAPSPSLPLDDDEVRVTTGGKIRDVVEYSLARLEVRARPHPFAALKKTTESAPPRSPRLPIPEPQDASQGRVTLAGVGKAITKVITVAEILKRRVAGLHQRTSLHTLEMDETFEPKDEGLNVVRRKRRVGAVTVTLCGDISRIDAGAVGYQAPVPEDEVTPKVTARTKPKKKTNEPDAKTDDEDEDEAKKRPKRGKRYGRNLRGRDRRKHMETPPPPS